ncbi:MAG: hypothetical protein LR015_06070 [Verrucomicrobia bacterium]|nr:hypothetical protein [Verrucomicrobiota bacterium]
MTLQFSFMAKPPSDPSSSTDSWTVRLAQLLRKEQTLQAVAWDDQHTEIELATLGKVSEQELRNLLGEVLQTADSASDLSDLRYRREADKHHWKSLMACRRK